MANPWLHVFVYMTDVSWVLQVLHLIAKFFDIKAGVDLNNKVIGFVGERMQFRVPYPVILPMDNAWKWRKGGGQGGYVSCGSEKFEAMLDDTQQ